MSSQPLLSTRESAKRITLGTTDLLHRISSKDTGGSYSVVEFITAPARGVGMHVHKHEDELVFLAEGTLEVTVGDDTLTVDQGAMAMLPRGIPHGFVNVGDKPSRLVAILLPGGLDQFFLEMGALFAHGREPDAADVEDICSRYGIQFVADPATTY